MWRIPEIGRVLVCTDCRASVRVVEACEGARTDEEHRYPSDGAWVTATGSRSTCKDDRCVLQTCHSVGGFRGRARTRPLLYLSASTENGHLPPRFSFVWSAA